MHIGSFCKLVQDHVGEPLRRMVPEAVFRAKEDWVNKVTAEGEASKRT